jgi:hypothetical protein
MKSISSRQKLRHQIWLGVKSSFVIIGFGICLLGIYGGTLWVLRLKPLDRVAWWIKFYENPQTGYRKAFKRLNNSFGLTSFNENDLIWKELRHMRGGFEFTHDPCGRTRVYLGIPSKLQIVRNGQTALGYIELESRRTNDALNIYAYLYDAKSPRPIRSSASFLIGSPRLVFRDSNYDLEDLFRTCELKEPSQSEKEKIGQIRYEPAPLKFSESIAKTIKGFKDFKPHHPVYEIFETNLGDYQFLIDGITGFCAVSYNCRISQEGLVSCQNPVTHGC